MTVRERRVDADGSVWERDDVGEFVPMCRECGHYLDHTHDEGYTACYRCRLLRAQHDAGEAR